MSAAEGGGAAARPAPGAGAPRAGASRAPAPSAAPVILFDGVCNLCEGTVRFVLARDRTARFRFAALQSHAAQQLLRRFELPADALDSVVLIEAGRAWVRSSAALRILRGLPWPWPLLSLLLLVPRALRDLGYDFVARHRYAWFGRRAECLVPTPELRARFLE